jgi:hypothetical protein
MENTASDGEVNSFPTDSLNDLSAKAGLARDLLGKFPFDGKYWIVESKWEPRSNGYDDYGEIKVSDETCALFFNGRIVPGSGSVILWAIVRDNSEPDLDDKCRMPDPDFKKAKAGVLRWLEKKLNPPPRKPSKEQRDDTGETELGLVGSDEYIAALPLFFAASLFTSRIPQFVGSGRDIETKLIARFGRTFLRTIYDLSTHWKILASLRDYAASDTNEYFTVRVRTRKAHETWIVTLKPEWVGKEWEKLDLLGE